MKALLWEGRGTLRDRHSERDGLIASFERHTAAVKEAVPADRLLVWDAKEGWEPLCEFLGVDVPPMPLPHVNDSQTFKDRLVEMSLGTLDGWWEREKPAPVG
jgi:hypothetical protein